MDDSKNNPQLTEIQKIIMQAASQNNVQVSLNPKNSNKVIYIKDGNYIYSINSKGVKRRSHKKEKELLNSQD